MPLYEPPVQVRTLAYDAPGIRIQYPQVAGLASPQAEERINRAIIGQIQEMQRIQQHVQTGSHPQTTGNFEIKTNERGILSLVLSNYTYSAPMAHGYTIAKGLTFNARTRRFLRAGRPVPARLELSSEADVGDQRSDPQKEPPHAGRNDGNGPADPGLLCGR